MNSGLLMDNIKQIHGMLKAIERNMPNDAELVILLSSVYLAMGKLSEKITEKIGIEIEDKNT